VFALFAGVYYWFPKFTGRFLDERLGLLHLFMTFVGFHLTFLVQFVLGLQGMPRRVTSYLPTDDFTTLNRISSIGAFLLGAAVLPFLWNVWRSYRRGVRAGADAWEAGQTLEWATPSPPPPHNFEGPLPPIRSNRPVWDLNHPPKAGITADVHG
jgi:cytochrome c oxidase subunit 1